MRYKQKELLRDLKEGLKRKTEHI